MDHLNASKVIGFLIGAFFMSLLFLFAWWLVWDGRADSHAQAVEDNIVALERYWGRNGSSNLKIHYDELVASGFPYGLYIRLLRPQVQISLGDGTRFIVSGAYVDFVPEDEDTAHYRLSYLQDASATYRTDNGSEQHDYLYMSHNPIVHVRQRGKTAAFNELGIEYPPNLILSVDRGGRTAKLPFQFNGAPEPVWQPMPADLGAVMLRLNKMLRRSMRGL